MRAWAKLILRRRGVISALFGWPRGGAAVVVEMIQVEGHGWLPGRGVFSCWSRSVAVSVAEGCRGRRVVVLVVESCRAGRGGLSCDGELSGGGRRVAGRGAESFRITEGFPCYHADDFPCCGNSPPGGRHGSRIMNRGVDHQRPGAALPQRAASGQGQRAGHGQLSPYGSRSAAHAVL